MFSVPARAQLESAATAIVEAAVGKVHANLWVFAIEARLRSQNRTDLVGLRRSWYSYFAWKVS